MFSRIKIKLLLPILFGVVTVIAVAQGAVALVSLASLRAQVDLVGRERMPRVLLINKLDHSVSSIRRSHADTLLAANENEIKTGEAGLSSKIAERDQLLNEYSSLIGPSGTRAQFDSLRTALAAYDDAAVVLVDQVRHQKLEDAKATYRGPIRDAARTATAALDAMTTMNLEITSATVAASDGVYMTARAWVIGAIVFGALVATVAALISYFRVAKPITTITRSMSELAQGQNDKDIPFSHRRDELGGMAAAVSIFRDNAVERLRLESEAVRGRSISEAERAEREQQKNREATQIKEAVNGVAFGLSRLAEGDVAHRIEHPFAGDLDILRTNFNASVHKLQQTLQAVGENARAIDAGASEIRSAADDLSKRTEQQAASVEETAAALEQVTTAVKDASHRADEAGQVVQRTRSGAENSGEIVRSAVAAMHEIERSSDEISSIIGVIDDIAFQTNLLALNAGVEAARAGEAGKGFAVVAQEVRELAQRSAHAAKEIKALITKSGEQVRHGVELVGQTGAALGTIVSDVAEISTNVSSIVATAKEQSVGLHEINLAVNQMDQGTQKNAAMVEQTTAATHGLAAQAEELNRLLSQFKLRNDRKNHERDKGQRAA